MATLTPAQTKSITSQISVIQAGINKLKGGSTPSGSGAVNASGQIMSGGKVVGKANPLDTYKPGARPASVSEQEDGLEPIAPGKIDASQPSPLTTQAQPPNQQAQAMGASVPMEQAVKSLQSGGLKGTQLADATTSLKDWYQKSNQMAGQTGIAPPQDAGAGLAGSKQFLDANQSEPNEPPSLLGDIMGVDSNFDSIFTSYDEFMSPQTQKTSLLEEYKQMEGSLGIQAMNEELLDAKRIIEGTEDDIRAEVTATGGFATDSQVLALSNARNKSLIKNYNYLLESRDNAMTQLGTYMDLSVKDREMASAEFDRKMNFAFKVAEFQERATTNARNGLKWAIENGAGAEILKSPYETQLAEKTLGMPLGSLSGIVQQQQQAQDLERRQAEADLRKTNADIANTYSTIKDRETKDITKPPTQAQLKVGGYADRLIQSNQTINAIGSQFTGRGSIFSNLLPSAFQSEDKQKFEQSKRNFINAVLRQESGAAISPTEFESAEKQYFPRPGDTQGVIQQKAANRQLVINNFVREAGSVVSPETIIAGVSVTSKPKAPLANRVANFFGAKGITEQFGASLAKAKAPESEKPFVEFPKMKEVVGSAIQTGSNFLPGAGVGAKFAKKVAVGAGTGYGFDVGSKLQQGKEKPLKPSAGTAIGASIPVVGAVVKPATKVVGRLLKGLGSGLSGVSTETIDKIVSNPRVAQEATKRINKSGNAKVLEENARQVMEGVRTIKKQARTSFGEGVGSLKAEDIAPKTFRQAVQPFLDESGVVYKNGKPTFSKVEFSEPRNIKIASKLVNKLSKTELNGLSLRKLLNEIEESRYKIATSDERLSFNAFTKGLAETVKKAITGSTSKLGEINKKFSSDMQLAEATEDILGKVKFNNLPEVVKATKKLEGLFAQKGIAPDVIDDFLKRIGVSPEDFKTGEAVRQISNKSMKANEPGVSLGEILRSATSAVVTPQAIRNISIKLGIAQEVLLPELNKLSPLVRNVIMNAIVQNGR